MVAPDSTSHACVDCNSWDVELQGCSSNLVVSPVSCSIDQNRDSCVLLMRTRAYRGPSTAGSARAHAASSSATEAATPRATVRKPTGARRRRLPCGGNRTVKARWSPTLMLSSVPWPRLSPPRVAQARLAGRRRTGSCRVRPPSGCQCDWHDGDGRRRSAFSAIRMPAWLARRRRTAISAIRMPARLAGSGGAAAGMPERRQAVSVASPCPPTDRGAPPVRASRRPLPSRRWRTR